MMPFPTLQHLKILLFPIGFTISLFYRKFFKNYANSEEKDGARLPKDHPQIRPASMIFEYPNCIPFYDYHLW